jgi:hypothetical protein
VAGFSSTGSGVLGRSLAATGESDAVKGMNASATGRGVAGYALATTGANIGVLGQTDSSSGTAVRGFATATTGTTYGGRFSNVSPDGFAIHGTSANSGVAYFQISNRSNNETAVEVSRPSSLRVLQRMPCPWCRPSTSAMATASWQRPAAWGAPATSVP